MATDQPGRDEVRLRVHLTAPPQRVFQFLATDAGRAAFWAESAMAGDGYIDFRFANGMTHRGRILAADAPRRFEVEYFGGARAAFELTDDGAGGTDLTLTERGIPAEWFAEQRAGWVTVLLALKGAVDFSIDLRNHDPNRTWEKGFVDV